MALPVVPLAIGGVVILLGGTALLMRSRKSSGKTTPPRPKDGVHDDYGAGVSDGVADGTHDGNAGILANPTPMLNYSADVLAQKKYEDGYATGYSGAYATAYGLSKISMDSVDPDKKPTVEETETKKPSTGADRSLGQKDGYNYGFAMGQMAAIAAAGGSDVHEPEAKDNAKRDSGWQFGSRNFAYNQGWDEGFQNGWHAGVVSITKTSGFVLAQGVHVGAFRSRRRADLPKIRTYHRTGALSDSGARRIAMALDVHGDHEDAKTVRALYRASDPRVGAAAGDAEAASKLPPYFKRPDGSAHNRPAP